jgi:hypothetical protein
MSVRSSKRDRKPGSRLRRAAILFLVSVLASALAAVFVQPARADVQLDVVVDAAVNGTEATAYDLGVVSGSVGFEVRIACPPPGSSFASINVDAGPGIPGPGGGTSFVCMADEVVTRDFGFTATSQAGTYTRCAHVRFSFTDPPVTSIGRPNGTACFSFTVARTAPVCSPPATRPATAAIQAEAWNDSLGLTTWGPCVGIGSFDAGDWMRYSKIDFGAVSPTSVSFVLATPNCCNQIFVRLDSETGPVVATLTTTATANGGGWQQALYTTQTAPLTSPVTGVRTVFLTTQNPATAPYAFGIANIDSFSFA